MLKIYNKWANETKNNKFKIFLKSAKKRLTLNHNYYIIRYALEKQITYIQNRQVITNDFECDITKYSVKKEHKPQHFVQTKKLKKIRQKS